MVALASVPSGTPLDQSIDDDTFVIAVDSAARLDDDGVLALTEYAEEIAADAWFGDLIIEGTRHRRPAWSPTRLLSDPACSSPLAVRAGWLREHELSPDDPAIGLRLAAAEATVAHLPRVLSHHTAPLAAPDSEAIRHHLDMLGLPSAPTAASVSIVIPSAGQSLDSGAPAIDQLLDAFGPLPDRVEVLVVIGDEFAADADGLAQRPGVRVLRRPPGPFNFAAAVNLGIRAAAEDLVLLLNDDMVSDGLEFLDTMAWHLSDASVGAVGALLAYPDGTIQHAGVVIDDARPLHPFVGWSTDDAAEHGALDARDVIAVTGGCLMARRRDLLAVGGLSVGFPLSFNDIDLCVRLRRAGWRVVMEPAAQLVHYETLSRSPRIEPAEWDRWIDRWGEIVDPWYHPDWERPDDPHTLSRNADHLAPSPDAPSSGDARLPILQSQVHRGRAERVAG